MIVVRLATGHRTGWIHQLRAVIISGRTASEGRLLSTPLAQVSPKRPPSNQQREEDSPQSSARPRVVLRNVVASLARRLAPAPIGTRRRIFHHGGLRVHKGTSDICVLRSLRIRRPGLVCVGWCVGVLERVWASQGKDGKSVRLLLVLRT